MVYGKVGNEKVAGLSDMNRREFLMMAILAAAGLGMGLYPAPVIDVMHASVDHLLQHITESKVVGMK